MRTARLRVPAALALAVLPLSWAAGPGLERVAGAQLCVTEGRLESLPSGRLAVAESKFRAVAGRAGGSAAELRFTYLGPTRQSSALGSGAVREQLGLKLRAQDPCNLVYVMWRITPVSKLVVSLKKNPGQHTSAECANHGYRNLKPERSEPLPAPAPGSSHVLSAGMRGDELQVQVDGATVWAGRLGGEARALNGPAGLRSDNVRFEFDLYAPAGAAAACPRHGEE